MHSRSSAIVVPYASAATMPYATVAMPVLCFSTVTMPYATVATMPCATAAAVPVLCFSATIMPSPEPCNSTSRPQLNSATRAFSCAYFADPVLTVSLESQP